MCGDCFQVIRGLGARCRGWFRRIRARLLNQHSRSIGVRNSPDIHNIRGCQNEERSSSKTVSHELTHEYESMSNRNTRPITDDNTATSPPKRDILVGQMAEERSQEEYNKLQHSRVDPFSSIDEVIYEDDEIVVTRIYSNNSHQVLNPRERRRALEAMTRSHGPSLLEEGAEPPQEAIDLVPRFLHDCLDYMERMNSDKSSI